MDIIKFQPFRRLSNQELIDEIFDYMSVINEYKDNKDDYCDKIMILDNLIKEGKRRKIALDNKSLSRKIFLE